ncbi:MAG: protein translocase SEC61 complex subunit gamma [Candidatus Woesearchaeota archaeon]
MEVATEIGWKQKIREFIVECIRVLKVTRKPTNDEYKTIVKVSGLGILLIGLIGFVVAMLNQFLFKGF